MSCVSVGIPRSGEPLQLEQGKVLVFGKLRVSEGPRSVVPLGGGVGELLFPGGVAHFKLSLFAVETGKKALYPSYESDGTFWWILPRGTYLVFHTPTGPGAYNEVLAAFQTPREESSVYVGTLALEIDTAAGKDYDVEYAATGVRIDDEFASACADLMRRFPRGGGTPRRSLMFSDPELPPLLSSWSRGRCDRILADHGLRAFDR